MISDKVVKMLGTLGSVTDSSSLPKGLINTYYIYYKPDGDLYMYDSYKDIEYNLFNLTVPVKGTLEINTFKRTKGLLKLFTSFIAKGALILNTTYSQLSGSATIMINVKSISDGSGFLTINTTYRDAVGNISVTVLDAN